MKASDTMSEAISELRDEGYTEDFNLRQHCLECRNGAYQLFHDQFTIDRYYRFEGENDPADEAIVYAISSDTFSLKGVLVNGYGIYTEALTDEMMQKLKT